MTIERTAHERAAYDRGKADAIAAASWCIDGNTSQEHIRRVLSMLDDGDPQVFDYLPREPNLSGEFADDLTPARLAAEVGMEDVNPNVDDLDAIATAYEDGVGETFQAECERILRAALEPTV